MISQCTHIFNGDLLVLVKGDSVKSLVGNCVFGLGELLLSDKLNRFSLVDDEGWRLDKLLLLLEATALEVEKLMGLSFAQNNP